MPLVLMARTYRHIVSMLYLCLCVIGKRGERTYDSTNDADDGHDAVNGYADYALQERDE